MSAEHIQRLHEQASERYLQGDYPAAMAAWQEVLSLDAGDVQALEGVRMSKSLCADLPAAATVNEATTSGAVRPVIELSLEDEIEDGLAVLGAAPAPARTTEAGRHADRQHGGIDFGDSASVAAIPLALAGPTPSTVPAPAAAPVAPGWSSSPGRDVLLDLDEPAAPTPAPTPTDAASSVAEEALRHRVLDLLDEARECRDKGEMEAALGVISRIYILDESNEAARALEAELRAPDDDQMREVESWIAEGVQAFDVGRLEEAADLFNRVLERSPGHREAIQYLDAIAARDISRGGGSDNMLGDADLLGDISLDAPPETSRASAAASSLVDELARPMGSSMTVPAGALEMPDETPVATPRRALPRWLIPGAIGLVAVSGAVALAMWWMGGAPPNDIATSPAPSSAPRPKAKGPAGKPADDATPPAAATSSPDAALGRARAAMAAGDYAAAVLDFNEALAAKPGDPEIVAGLQEAGDLYRAWKVEQEQIDSIRVSFRDGEFTAALRALYRLPESYDRRMVDRWKVNGWFNLGVVALRAGDATQAVSHFDEALAITTDQDVVKWRTFAQRYKTRAKDRTFYAAAEAIPFRSFD